jgi:hypothetical protein
MERTIVAAPLVPWQDRTYLGHVISQGFHAMSSSPHRYRVTVTPIERDGLPCRGRCSIEFDQACGEDWMRLIEGTQRLPGFSGDERTALVVALRLLDGLARRPRGNGDDPLAGLRTPLASLLQRIDSQPA